MAEVGPDQVRQKVTAALPGVMSARVGETMKAISDDQRNHLGSRAHKDAVPDEGRVQTAAAAQVHDIVEILVARVRQP